MTSLNIDPLEPLVRVYFLNLTNLLLSIESMRSLLVHNYSLFDTVETATISRLQDKGATAI